MSEENKDTTQKETTTKETTQPTEQKETDKKENQTVDVEKVKTESISEFLKKIGVETEESLQGIVKSAKDAEELNKTELQKKDDVISATTKELATEKEARIIAEAKLAAIQLGAKPELVDDLVVVAKSKVTKDKDINAIVAEMKDGASGKIYFGVDEEEADTTTVTRKRVQKPSEKKEEEKPTDDKSEKNKGSLAERLLAGKRQPKNYYYGK